MVPSSTDQAGPRNAAAATPSADGAAASRQRRKIDCGNPDRIDRRQRASGSAGGPTRDDK